MKIREIIENTRFTTAIKDMFLENLMKTWKHLNEEND